MRKKRILPHIAALIAALCMIGLADGFGAVPKLFVETSAAEIDGIGASKSKVRPGETFNVFVNVPAANTTADTIELKIYFDPSVFEVTSWGAQSAGSSALTNRDNTNGIIALAAANVSVSVSSGLTFSATVRVKSGVKPGNYSFVLRSADVSNYDNGFQWYPQTWEVPIRIANKLVTVNGKVSVNCANLTDNATVRLVDGDGNAIETNVKLTYNSSTKKYEGNYSFTEAESETSYTVETIVPGCTTHKEPITVGTTSMTTNMQMNKVGDVDGDGDVKAKDATQILKYLVGSRSELKNPDGTVNQYLLAVGSVTGGRTLSVQDATQILRYVAGLPSVFG